MNNRAILPLILTTIGAAPAVASAPTLQATIGTPDDFTLSGSNRFRYESMHDQIRPGFRRDDDIVAIRTTLLGEYHRDGWRIGGELYDSRVYGAKADSAVGANDVNTLELVQAYAGGSFTDIMGKGSKGTIQFGRFLMPLGSRRLTAADEYRNTATGHTGIRIDLARANGANATLFYVLPQVRLPDDAASVIDNKVQFDRESFDLRFWGALLTKPHAIGRTLAEFGYFGLAERDAPGRPNRNRHLHSADIRLLRERRPGAIDYEIEAVYQFGTIRSTIAPTAPTFDVSAWFIHAGTGYSLPTPLKARISVDYDYASGDGRGGHFGRFDTLFGMRRADFSPAGLLTAIGRANISSPGIRIEMAPTSRLDGHLSYRAMWLADRHDAFSTTGVQDATGRSGSFAGHQIDMRIRYWLVPQALRFELNADLIARGNFLKYAPNAPEGGDLHYVSTALTTTF